MTVPLPPRSCHGDISSTNSSLIVNKNDAPDSQAEEQPHYKGLQGVYEDISYEAISFP